MATGLNELRHTITGLHDPKVIRKALLSLFSVYQDRIFEKGIASDGSGIGKYSTAPIYVNPAKSPRAIGRPIGKSGRSKFLSGDDHKTRYFEGGYKAFREKIGRPTDVVNLQLTEDLKDNTLPELDQGRYVFGFGHDFASKKATGNEERFKKQIFDLTVEETESIDNRIFKAMEELGL